MEINEFIQFIERKWQVLVVFVLLFTTLAFVFSVVQPQKYGSDQRLLVVAKFAEDVDPYAATRSTEHLTNLLSEVMYSERFLQAVLDTGYAVDDRTFPALAKKRKKVWQKTLRTKVLGDSGILAITIFHKDRFVAEQLSLAVGSVLREQHGDYHSRGKSVVIQTLDQPIISLRPVQPNIPLNTVAGAVMGFLSGLSFIYLFPSKESIIFGTRQRLVKAHEPDWSRPLAIPNQRLRSESITFKPQENILNPQTTPEPPINLPVA